jgi:hypothetical protein
MGRHEKGCLVSQREGFHVDGRTETQKKEQKEGKRL